MSGSTNSGAASTDGGQRWAALDKQNERLVDAADPLLVELHARGDGGRAVEDLPAAS